MHSNIPKLLILMLEIAKIFDTKNDSLSDKITLSTIYNMSGCPIQHGLEYCILLKNLIIL